MRLMPVLLLVASCLLLLSCKAVKVSSNWNPNVDFASLKTWSFTEPSPGHPIAGSINQDDFYANRVEYAIKEDLESKGFQQVPDGAPASFHVGFHHVVNSDMSIAKLNEYAGYDNAGMNTGPAPGSGFGLSEDPFVNQYMKDTLFIDITTGGGDDLIWRGSGVSNRGRSYGSTPEQDVIDNRVQKIMADFPPSSGGKSSSK